MLWKNTGDVPIRGIFVPFPKAVDILVLPPLPSLTIYTGWQFGDGPLPLLYFTEGDTDVPVSASKVTQLRARVGLGFKHRLLSRCSLTIPGPSQTGQV